MKTITDNQGCSIELPTLQKVGSLLRNNKWSKRKYEILNAFVIGSVAKGTANPESDIDIAIIIPPVRGKTSLKVSEHYHAKFHADHQMPHFKGRRLDFQFFYETDRFVAKYAKIDLPTEQDNSTNG